MSEDRDDDGGKSPRKYKDGNTDENGNYITGKYRPPPDGQFKRNDGRKRGKRTKGTKNLKTDFAEEVAEQTTATENGKSVRVSKQRYIVKRLIVNASKGQNAAIRTFFEQHEKLIGEPPQETAKLSPEHQVILDDVMRLLGLAFEMDMPGATPVSNPADDPESSPANADGKGG